MADLSTPSCRGGARRQGGAEEVGNKAWNLMRMAQAGLPVPPAFVLPTAWCGRSRRRDEAAARRRLAEGIAGWKPRPAWHSAPRAGRCWCPSAPARRCRCRA